MLVAAGPVGAVGIGNEAQDVDGADEGTDEEQINEGDEAGRVLGAAVEEEGADSPCKTQDRYNEEHQNRCRRAEVLAVVNVDEPGLPKAVSGDSGWW